MTCGNYINYLGVINIKLAGMILIYIEYGMFDNS